MEKDVSVSKTIFIKIFKKQSMHFFNAVLIKKCCLLFFKTTMLIASITIRLLD